MVILIFQQIALCCHYGLKAADMKYKMVWPSKMGGNVWEFDVPGQWAIQIVTVSRVCQAVNSIFQIQILVWINWRWAWKKASISGGRDVNVMV